MPQGKGTYGSKVGRPSKERTSFVNDNGWNNKGDNSSMLTNLQAATSRQYSNPIDFSNPVQRRGEQIRGTHPIGDPSKPVMRKHPIGDPKEKITGQLMSGDRKAVQNTGYGKNKKAMQGIREAGIGIKSGEFFKGYGNS